MEYQANLVLDQKATLGEGPSWDAPSKKLYWVDIMQKKVFIYDRATGTNQTVQLDQMPGAIVPRTSGGAVVALESGFYALNLENGDLALLADPEKDIPDNRFNDGKCDPKGRFWAGTMTTKQMAPVGSLYCLDTDLSYKRMVSGVGCSNGLAWSPDQKTMYFIDSITKQVAAFDYDLSTGSIFSRRAVVTIPEGGGVPDGMTIDNEGMLWVAQWGGYQVSRWNPATGEMIGRIPIPAAHVTSCTFAGDNLDELYITTARAGVSDEALTKQPYAGGLFMAKPGVRGIGTFPFAG